MVCDQALPFIWHLNLVDSVLRRFIVLEPLLPKSCVNLSIKIELGLVGAPHGVNQPRTRVRTLCIITSHVARDHAKRTVRYLGDRRELGRFTDFFRGPDRWVHVRRLAFLDNVLFWLLASDLQACIMICHPIVAPSLFFVRFVEERRLLRLMLHVLPAVLFPPIRYKLNLLVQFKRINLALSLIRVEVGIFLQDIAFRHWRQMCGFVVLEKTGTSFH